MKKTILFISLISLSLFSFGCASLIGIKKPTAELNHVFLRDGDLTGSTLVFVIGVENPNDRELTVDDVTYKVFLSGKPFAEASTGKKVSVAALSKTQVEVPLPVKYAKLLGSLGEILQSRKVSYKIEGDAKFSFFRIPFSKEGKVELGGD